MHSFLRVGLVLVLLEMWVTRGLFAARKRFAELRASRVEEIELLTNNTGEADEGERSPP